MATHKTVLTEFSLSQLAYLATCDTKTARRRLDAAGLKPSRVDGRTQYYPPRLALPVVFNVGGGLDPSRERARLDAARAEREELRNAQARRELFPTSRIETALLSVVSPIAQALDCFPSRMAPIVHAGADAGSIAETEKLLREEIHEMRHSLADLAEGCRARFQRYVEGAANPAAEPGAPEQGGKECLTS